MCVKVKGYKTGWGGKEEKDGEKVGSVKAWKSGWNVEIKFRIKRIYFLMDKKILEN